MHLNLQKITMRKKSNLWLHRSKRKSSVAKTLSENLQCEQPIVAQQELEEGNQSAEHRLEHLVGPCYYVVDRGRPLFRVFKFKKSENIS